MRTPVDAAYVHEQYERVRRDATTTDLMALRGPGVALLMTRGISSWLAALQTLAPPPRVGAERRDAAAAGVAWRPDERAQLTHALASLVLTCVQEVVPQ